jgi:DNA invertase Pin-like site-specific DNA recombinase
MTGIAAAEAGYQGKIQGDHRDRLAVVYVRQSTVQQVERHQESTRLQYGLVERAVALGWARAQVLVIDEDLGKSGATAQGRTGFQRLVAEVGLAHVGIVLGVEMSRLARSNRDWHQLLEVCALFGTLLGDLDGVYDLQQYNDRLLLGLKGTMSEAELHLLKQRMLAGKEAKARRGELPLRLPMGYVRHPSGEVIKDPDAQAQATIQLVFTQFQRRQTLNGVLQTLVRQGVQLPYRLPSGPRKGELEWRRPNRVTLSNLLHNPIYAGAYVYGRRPIDPRRQQPGRPATGRVVARPEAWRVTLRDRLPAYLTWEAYERNRRQLAANQAQNQGAVRRGPSLLSGLLTCGRCGLRMTTSYHNNGHGLRYSCNRMAVDYGEAPCQSLAGTALDALVVRLVLQALEPAALEVSLRVAEDVEAERAQWHQQWAQRLERARYAAERAFRQYSAVEPEHRLVARTLERQWEEALAAEVELQREHARFVAEQPAALSAQEREAIRRLASDIPALWEAPSTTAADRQALIRQVVERVVVTVQGESERVGVQVHWRGGDRTGTTLVRPVARLEQLSYYPALLERVCALHAQGSTSPAIAAVLNAEGWRPAKRRETFNAAMVQGLLARQGLRAAVKATRKVLARGPEEWTLGELARTLGMARSTLRTWRREGWLKARKDTTTAQGVWLVWADEAEVARLKAKRHATPTRGRDGTLD